MESIARDGFVGANSIAKSDQDCLAVVNGVCVTQQSLDRAVAIVESNLKQFNPEKYLLGSVCKLGHTWLDTELCLRRKRPGDRPGNCVLCEDRKPDYKGGKLKIDTLQRSNPPEIAPNRFLGELCPSFHNFLSTGLSLRIRADRHLNCVQCLSVVQLNYRTNNRDDINAKKRKKAAQSKGQLILKELCGRQHDYEGTGQSLRNGKGDCVECMKENVRRHHQARLIRASGNIGATELGSLCRRGHEFESTGASLRKIKNQVCVECAKIQASNAYRRNPERMIQHNRKRRGLKLASSVYPYTLKDVQQLIEKFGHCCAYCQKPFKKTGKRRYAIDHVIPLSKGGIDALSNVVPVCQSCNSSKNDSDPYEWYSSQLFFSEGQWNFIQAALNA